MRERLPDNLNIGAKKIVSPEQYPEAMSPSVPEKSLKRQPPQHDQKQSGESQKVQQLMDILTADGKDTQPDKITISIIVNAFNESAEIGRLLDSLKRSWFPGMEVVISNDGSTDDTAAIVRRYIEESVVSMPRGWLTLDDHENLGFSGAKNSGVRFARGDYLFFFDADAPIPLGLLREDLRQMQERNLDFATHYLVPQNKLQHYPTALKNKIMVGVINRLINPTQAPGCGGILVKKAMFNELGGFRETTTGIGEDVDFSKRVSHVPEARIGMIEGIRMPMNMRRFEKQGYIRTLWKWIRVGIGAALREKVLPFSQIDYSPSRRGAAPSQQRK